MIKIETSEDFHHIILARPKKKNAINSEMYAQMAAALEQAAGSTTVKAAIISHEGDFFCAGHDLNDFLQNPLNDDHPLLKFLEQLKSFPKYLIMVLNGSAVGIGTTMLCHADFVIAKQGITLETPFVTLGLNAEAGSSQLFSRIFGHHIARDMLLLGHKKPIEMFQTTLLHALCPNKNIVNAILHKLKSDISHLPLSGILANKDLMQYRHETLDETFIREAQSFKFLLQTKETQKIIAQKLTTIEQK